MTDIFALEFDDLKRKMLAKEPAVLLNKLKTCYKNTPEYDTYLGLFIMPENTSIHVCIEQDANVYTFYTIITDKRAIELAQERKYREYAEQREAQRLASTFV